jgi:hypothetical protein
MLYFFAVPFVLVPKAQFAHGAAHHVVVLYLKRGLRMVPHIML